jgi:branched-chain amino acid transport system substrate-binding protein
MKSRALTAFLLIGLLTVTCESGPPAHVDIVIASDLPETGLRSVILPMEQAIRFAISQEGAIDGLTLGYLPLDDSIAATPNQVKGMQNVERMIDDSRVLGMIGPYTSNVAVEEIPVANHAGLAMISPSNTNWCLTMPAEGCGPPARPPGTNNYFRIAPPDPLQGRAMARYAGGVLGLRRVAAFNEWGPWLGALLLDQFSAELRRFGGEVVLRQDLGPGTTDFISFLDLAKRLGADAIFAVGNQDDGVCVARAQANTLLPNAYFLGTDGITGIKECITEAGDPPRMLAPATDVDPTHSADPRVQSIVAAYKKVYPKASDVSAYTFAAYDCTRILLAAIARAIQKNGGKVPSRTQVIAEIANGRAFQGVTGTFAFDQNGDAVSPLMSMFEVRDGRWVDLGPVDASLRTG